MKTLVFSSFFAVMLLLAGCQFEKLDPVTPDKTFEKTFGTQLNLEYPAICLQPDGNIRVLATARSGLFPPAYSGLIFVLNEEGGVNWANDGPTAIAGGIVPRDLGGYYYAVGGGTNLSLNTMKEDGSHDSSVETPNYSDQTIASYLPVDLLPDFSYGRMFVYGFTELNDSLHIAMFDNFWNVTSYAYNSAIHIPNLKTLVIGKPYSVQKTSEKNGLIVCGNGHLVKINVNDGGGFFPATWEIVWDKAQPTASGIGWAVQTSDGGYLAIGGGALLKTDASGDKQWDQPFSGSFILPTSDGSYLITGSKDGKAYSAKIKADAAAPSVIWERTYPNGKNLEKAVEAPDQGFYMVGSLSPSLGLYMVKTDENGYVY